LRSFLRLLAFLFFLFAVWAGGFMLFVSMVPTAVSDPDRPTDAIVVLTGGGERLATGFDLLERKLAPVLFISGVDSRNDEAELRRHANRSQTTQCCVIIGYEARDTVGNGLEVAEWARKEHVHSMRLVTADYHMPRSEWLIQRAVPQATIVPNPVFAAGLRRERWWEGQETTRVLLAEYHKYVVQRVVAFVSDLIRKKE
jgi:uncharacterized SAM-binding protein YcdF (DUF218 family)